MRPVDRGRPPPGKVQKLERPARAGTGALENNNGRNSPASTTASDSGQAGRILRRDYLGNAEWRDLTSREAAAVERVSAADATWFEAHPKRSHRLRPAIADED
jgi:hypothetical protein